VPSVASGASLSALPGAAASPAGAPAPGAAMTGFGGGGPGEWHENTLDEPVWETLKRDVLTIGRNLRSVLIPINWDFANSSAALNNWDLWGPLVRGRGEEACDEATCSPRARRPGRRQGAPGPPRRGRARRGAARSNTTPPRRAASRPPQLFMLGLAITLSAGERKPSDVFAVSGRARRSVSGCGRAPPAAPPLQQPLRPGTAPPDPPPRPRPPVPQLVFTEVALGAIILTVNVILLGGDIVFFQSMCLIGYCLFPINIAAVVCLFVKLKVRRGAGRGGTDRGGSGRGRRPAWGDEQLPYACRTPPHPRCRSLDAPPA
jgi:hypothetical protein